MKKRLFTLIAVAGLAVLPLAGCSNSNIDTAKIRAAMQSIDAGQKATLEQGLADIDAGKYKEAHPLLQRVAFGAKLDQDQNKLLKETMKKLEAKMAAQQ